MDCNLTHPCQRLEWQLVFLLWGGKEKGSEQAPAAFAVIHGSCRYVDFISDGAQNETHIRVLLLREVAAPAGP